MRRRDFMAASCLAGLAPLGGAANAQDERPAPHRQLYELRLYQLDGQAKQQRLLDYFRQAATAALNRLGIAPVGVFRMMEGESANLYVLLPHPSAESVVTATRRLLSDAEYLKAAGSLPDAPLSDPAYKRIESSLLLAFEGMPKLEVPAKKESRVLQLRTYESHSVKAGQKKIEMFNRGGEIAIFRRTGLQPVFFGEALVGTKLPNLTYMLGFDDLEAQKASWDRFMKDPEWLKLKADPAYKDTVSNITNILLRPAEGSQI